MSDGIDISGGADEYETAAIIGALHHLLDEELAAGVRPLVRPTPQPWVLVERASSSPAFRRPASPAGDSIRPPS